MANRWDAERKSWEQEDSQWEPKTLGSSRIDFVINPLSFLRQVVKTDHAHKNEILYLGKLEKLKTI